VATVAQLIPGSSAQAAELGVGYWIWTTNFSAKQTCRFWRSFTVPANRRVGRALLRITGDNTYHLFLDGRDVGQGGNWKSLTEYDITWLLGPGQHVLAVEVLNDNLEAGLLFGLRVTFDAGEPMFLVSDSSWRIVPNSLRRWQERKRAEPDWEAAQCVGAVGQPPWWERPVSVIPTPTLLPEKLHFWQSTWFLAGLLTTCLLALGLSVWLTAKLAVQKRAQQLFQQERARIARDIHDDLGSGLTQLTLQGELAQCGLPADSTARKLVAALCVRSRSLSDVLDEIIWLVNPKRDSVEDFTSFVCTYAEASFAATEIRCRLEVDPELCNRGLELPVRRNLLLAIKEALSNVLRHSHATEVFLWIQNRGDRFEIMVEDNGSGFDPGRTRGDRNGLTNMSERMRIIGGECNLASMPGLGCRVVFLVPSVESAQPRSSWFSKWFRRPQVSQGEGAHFERSSSS
jgi:two-component sensor histidine kinase